MADNSGRRERMIEMNTVSTTGLVPRLEDLSCRQLLDLYPRLEAPSLDEMQGEYQARVLRQASLLISLLGRLSLNNPLSGRWQAKGFKPLNAEEGLGYNGFDRRGQWLVRYPMRLTIAPSIFDQKPCLRLDYTAYASLWGRVKMIDEVRRVGEGQYLGLGTVGVPGFLRYLPMPFLLLGPVRDYRGPQDPP